MLKYRPAAMLFLAFTAGIAAGLFFSFWAVFIIMALSWSVLMLIRPARRYRFAVVLTIFAFGIAYLLGLVYGFFITPTEPEKYKYYDFHATVQETHATDYGYRATIKIDDDNESFGGSKAYFYLDKKLNAGDCLKVYATLSVAKTTARGNGVDYIAYGSYEIAADYTPEGLGYKLLLLRSKISRSITKRFSGEAGAFYNALLTGDRSGLSDELNGSFARAGISHILAISGQHFSILVFSIYYILRFTTGKMKLSSFICLFIAVFYTLLVGASPSILRAAIMCCTVFITNILRTRIDSYTALCAAVMLIVIFAPYSVASVSLQLSFMSTLGILTFTESQMPRIKPSFLSKLWTLVSTPVILTIAATIFSVPIILTNFDYISVVSPVSNLAVNFLVTPAMVSAVIAAPAAALTSSADSMLKVPEFFYNLIVTISDYIASLSFSTVSSELPFSGLAIIPSLSLVAAGLLWRRKRFIRCAVACVAAFAIIIAGCYFGYNHSFVNNGLFYVQDDSKNCYVFCNTGNEKLLFDIKGSQNCSGVILDRGVTAIDVYVVTECSDDSLARLKSTGCYIGIERIYLPAEYKNTAFVQSYGKYGKSISFYEEKIAFDKAELYLREGDYMITSITNDKTVAIIGGIVYNYVESADALVITEACIQNQPPKELLPEVYDKLYIRKSKPMYFTRYMKEHAKTHTEYSNSVEIRYGKDGVWEVKR